MKELTIIMPLHEIEEDLFDECVSLISDIQDKVKVVFVVTESAYSIYNKIISKYFLDKEVIVHKGEPNFVTQLNAGIHLVKTPWFSIVEHDDEIKNNWYNNFLIYKNHHTDTDIFLPIVYNIDPKKEGFGYTNEAVWAYGFADVPGVISLNVLMDYPNFELSGGFFKTDKIIQNGKFKDNIKMTYYYEFLLRMINSGLKTMVIPKIMYKHMVFRENSIFYKYKTIEKITAEKFENWLKIAKDEFLYKEKREIELCQEV